MNRAYVGLAEKAKVLSELSLVCGRAVREPATILFSIIAHLGGVLQRNITSGIMLPHCDSSFSVVAIRRNSLDMYPSEQITSSQWHAGVH